MKAKGRPVLGAISGFFALLFIAIDLVLFGKLKLNSPLVTLLPIIGLIAGVVLGMWAPSARHLRPRSRSRRLRHNERSFR